LFPDKQEKKFWTSIKQIVMHNHNVQPDQAFAGQKLKFTGHLPDDQPLFAGLRLFEIILNSLAHFIIQLRV